VENTALWRKRPFEGVVQWAIVQIDLALCSS
jgi:hypothetical protein